MRNGRTRTLRMGPSPSEGKPSPSSVPIRKSPPGIATMPARDAGMVEGATIAGPGDVTADRESGRAGEQHDSATMPIVSSVVLVYWLSSSSQCRKSPPHRPSLRHMHRDSFQDQLLAEQATPARALRPRRGRLSCANTALSAGPVLVVIIVVVTGALAGLIDNHADYARAAFPQRFACLSQRIGPRSCR